MHMVLERQLADAANIELLPSATATATNTTTTTTTYLLPFCGIGDKSTEQ
jgi:hypothetical protein